MIRRLLQEMPSWAHRDSPVLRYEMQKQHTSNTFMLRLAAAAGQVFIAVILLIVSTLIVTRFFTQPAGINPTQSLWQILYMPTVGLQLFLSSFLLLIGGSTVSAERRRQTWDHLRVTTTGAELLLTARLLAVFYRVRVLFAVAYLARVVLLLTTLIEMSSHGGDYLGLLLVQTAEGVSAAAGLLLLAAGITAALLLPLTQAALDVALSLLMTTAITQYPWSVMAKMGLVVLRVSTTLVLIWLGATILSNSPDVTTPLAWGGLLAATAIGDQGLLLMQVTQTAHVWQRLPSGVWLGAAALLFMIVQTVFAVLVLRLAVRRAERTE